MSRLLSCTLIAYFSLCLCASAQPTTPKISTTTPSALSKTPPIPGAVKNPQGLWEADMDLGKCKMRMVLIPAGSFLMGSDTSEEKDEKPAHEVTISRDFWVGKVNVTQAQWQALMGKNPSCFRAEGERHPVEQISWNDTQDFINAANSATGDLSFRLPTEAEWEYACRAGSTGKAYGAVGSIAWYSRNCSEDTFPEGSRTTHPVGQKEPNAFGLYDMNGNVWQWCQDWYGEDYYGSSPKVDPQGPPAGFSRVFRGGSWTSSASTICSTARIWGHPIHCYRDLGFRLVMTMRQAPSKPTL